MCMHAALYTRRVWQIPEYAFLAWAESVRRARNVSRLGISLQQFLSSFRAIFRLSDLSRVPDMKSPFLVKRELQVSNTVISLSLISPHCLTPTDKRDSMHEFDRDGSAVTLISRYSLDFPGCGEARLNEETRTLVRAGEGIIQSRRAVAGEKISFLHGR